MFRISITVSFYHSFCFLGSANTLCRIQGMQVGVLLQPDLSIICNSQWPWFHLYLETYRKKSLLEQGEKGWLNNCLSSSGMVIPPWMPEISSQEQIKSSHSYFMTRSQCYTEMKPVILSGCRAIWSWTQKAPWIWCSEAPVRCVSATCGLLLVMFRGQNSYVEGPGLPAECPEMGCVLEVCKKYVCAAQIYL